MVSQAEHEERLLARRAKQDEPAPEDSYRMQAQLLAERDKALEAEDMLAHHVYTAAVALGWIAIHNHEARS